MLVKWARAQRFKLGKRLRDIAEPARLDVGNLSKFERGLLRLGNSERERLAAVLGIPVWLLEEEVQPDGNNRQAL
jgi:transcriptional regulator with XRE-family HTH domain